MLMIYFTNYCDYAFICRGRRGTETVDMLFA